MTNPVVIFGAGGVGGYVGAMLSLAGHEVTLVDGWPAHVEAVRKDGLRVDGPDGTHDARPDILHLGEAQSLRLSAPRLIVLCVKLYDTEWVATLARELLAPGTPVLTLQNALVEETVARIVGWPRVLGGIATGMNVELVGPGHIRRSSSRRFGPAAVFKIGEMHGRATPRAQAIAGMFSAVDTTAVTTNLWNDRWQKLCINAMISGASAVADCTTDVFHTLPEGYLAALNLASEAIPVGRALGLDPGNLFEVDTQLWEDAGKGDANARELTRRAFEAQVAKVVPGYVTGSLQDLRRGRRAEIDQLNGYVCALGREHGIPTPTHDRLIRFVAEIGKGSRISKLDNLGELIAAQVEGVRGHA